MMEIFPFITKLLMGGLAIYVLTASYVNIALSEVVHVLLVLSFLLLFLVFCGLGKWYFISINIDTYSLYQVQRHKEYRHKLMLAYQVCHLNIIPVLFVTLESKCFLVYKISTRFGP